MRAGFTAMIVCAGVFVVFICAFLEARNGCITNAWASYAPQMRESRRVFRENVAKGARRAASRAFVFLFNWWKVLIEGGILVPAWVFAIKYGTFKTQIYWTDELFIAPVLLTVNASFIFN
jgi:hypothetical protein